MNKSILSHIVYVHKKLTDNKVITLLKPGLYKYKSAAQTVLKKYSSSLICKRTEKVGNAALLSELLIGDAGPCMAASLVSNQKHTQHHLMLMEKFQATKSWMASLRHCCHAINSSFLFSSYMEEKKVKESKRETTEKKIRPQ